MKCPRCSGYLIEEDETVTSCLNCGHLDFDLPKAASFTPDRRRTSNYDRARPKGRRRKPHNYSFGSGVLGVCINGHGFRAVAHQQCIATGIGASA